MTSGELRFESLVTDIPYAHEPFYRAIMSFLVASESTIEDEPEVMRREIRRDAVSYKLKDGTLMRDEGGAVWLTCIVLSEIPEALKYALISSRPLYDRVNDTLWKG